MVKQIDRVIGDLMRQAEQFRIKGGQSICVALVGVNHSDVYTSYERDRSFPTDGRTYKHPIQEAEEATLRIRAQVRNYDEILVLPFTATNVAPFPFSWVNDMETTMQYSALLTRMSREYDRRFP